MTTDGFVRTVSVSSAATTSEPVSDPEDGMILISLDDYSLHGEDEMHQSASPETRVVHRASEAGVTVTFYRCTCTPYPSGAGDPIHRSTCDLVRPMDGTSQVAPRFDP